MQKTISFRTAQEQDIPLILSFIRQLAEYERMLDEVVATEELLREWLFERKKRRFSLRLTADMRWASYCSSTISQRFLDAPASIWRICLSCLNIAAMGMARPSSNSWPVSPLTAAAAVWNGRVLIGIVQASIFTVRSEHGPWTIGPFTALPAIRLQSLPAMSEQNIGFEGSGSLRCRSLHITVLQSLYQSEAQARSGLDPSGLETDKYHAPENDWPR